jgi:predicted membrane protein
MDKWVENILLLKPALDTLIAMRIICGIIGGVIFLVNYFSKYHKPALYIIAFISALSIIFWAAILFIAFHVIRFIFFDFLPWAYEKLCQFVSRKKEKSKNRIAETPK